MKENIPQDGANCSLVGSALKSLDGAQNGKKYHDSRYVVITQLYCIVCDNFKTLVK